MHLVTTREILYGRKSRGGQREKLRGGLVTWMVISRARKLNFLLRVTQDRDVRRYMTAGATKHGTRLIDADLLTVPRDPS